MKKKKENVCDVFICVRGRGRGSEVEETKATERKRARAKKSGDSVVKPRKISSQLHQRKKKTKTKISHIPLFSWFYAYKWVSFRC